MDPRCVLNKLTALNAFLIFAVYEFATGASTQASAASSPERQKNDEEGDMVKGLAFGLGGFFGLVILLCVLWKCCCTHDDSSGNGCSCCPDRNKAGNKHKNMGPRPRRMADNGAKVSPSPPSSVMSWSRNS